MISRVAPEVIHLRPSLQRVLHEQHRTAPVSRRTNGHALVTGTQRLFVSPVALPNIKVSEDFASGHYLEKFINKPEPLNTDDLKEIVISPEYPLNLDMVLYPSGSMPASPNQDSSYGHHAWTRDMAIKAYAMYMAGNVQGATKVIESLARFYNRDEERHERFGKFVLEPWSAKARYNSPNANVLPNIRAWINTNGHMEESPFPWDHRQLDALGMWLWVAFKMSNEGALDLQKLDGRLPGLNSQTQNNPNDSIFCVALKFLRVVEYWDQIDSGTWEDWPGWKRGTSIGICLAAFKEAQRYFNSFGWDSLTTHDRIGSLAEAMNSGRAYGQATLNGRLPVEIDESRSDAAQAFLLYPFNPGLTTQQENAILDEIYNNRIGEVGVTRRHVDYFQGQDYPFNPDHRAQGIFSAPSNEHKNAQWTLIDPILAAYYYNKYSMSDCTDEESFKKADAHTRRALAAIIKDDDVFRKTINNQVVSVHKGDIPELYWYDSKQERFRAGENSPLLMAEASYLFMFKEGIMATIKRDLKHRAQFHPH